jgi:hypothetical protein
MCACDSGRGGLHVNMQAEDQPLVGLAKGLTNPQPVTAEDLAAAIADKHNEAPVPEGDRLRDSCFRTPGRA